MLQVTVDVNLFVMKGHILEPIDQFSDMNAWIFQYEDTAHVESGNGETFNQVTMYTVIPKDFRGCLIFFLESL